MKKYIIIWLGFISIPLIVSGQELNFLVDTLKVPVEIPKEEKEELDAPKKNLPEIHTPESVIDTTKSIYYWRITKRTGEIVPGNPDTLLTGFPNRMLVDGMSIAMAYPGNLGQAMESRIYFDRRDRSEFMFADPYYNYAAAPEKQHFINTKIPYSNLTYQSGGSRENKEERLRGILSANFGKRLNVGVDVDYLYARGFYTSQAAKRNDWNFYSSYISDRHRLHAFINPTSYTNAENGGISDDRWITDPTSVSSRKSQTRNIPTQYTNTWNRQKGMEYYLNYHYNLGFERDTEQQNEDGETIKQFIPVSSVIYTFNYKDKNRRFNSTDSTNINEVYDNVDYWKTGLAVNDSTSYWSMSHTVGLSLREGFSQWAKFDLTGFVTHENRKYTMMQDSLTNMYSDQQSTYIGGEIAKRTGKVLRYDAQGSFGLQGYNLGDFQLSGKVETRIPLFKDTAAITLKGSIKNLAPTFYENHFHSKYLWWDEDFNKVRKVFIGGSLDFPQTKTNLSLGVENVSNSIYFDKTGRADQHAGNIQILGVTLAQDMQLGALHWDNRFVYQTSSAQDIIPLPDLSVYSNLYLQFVAAKVLTIQLGGGAHYFTKYYSPTYEPVTQQFRLQNEMKVGNYPIINGYINCHLKYTRFFIEFYNLSASFISPPEYFYMPHYPLNPQIFKFGLSWDFHD